jgi:hypothetical protein
VEDEEKAAFIYISNITSIHAGTQHAVGHTPPTFSESVGWATVVNYKNGYHGVGHDRDTGDPLIRERFLDLMLGPGETHPGRMFN